MTNVRIKIDFSDISNQHDGIWMLIDGTCKNIKDVENQIVRTQKWLQGRDTSLFLQEYNLPSDELVHVLQSNDLVKVRCTTRSRNDQKQTNRPSVPGSLVPYPSSSSVSVCSLPLTSSRIKPPPLHDDLSSVNPSVAASLTNKDGASASGCINSIEKHSSSQDALDTTETDLTEADDNPSKEVYLVDDYLVDLKYLQNHKDDENKFQEEIKLDSPQPDPLVSERHESENKIGLEISGIDMKVLEEAKKRKIALILKRLGDYGQPWEENKKYDDGCIYYEGGTPERMWLYPWTYGLDDLNQYVQVNLCPIQVNLLILILIENGHPSPDGHGSHRAEGW